MLAAYIIKDVFMRKRKNNYFITAIMFIISMSIAFPIADHMFQWVGKKAEKSVNKSTNQLLDDIQDSYNNINDNLETDIPVLDVENDDELFGTWYSADGQNKKICITNTEIALYETNDTLLNVIYYTTENHMLTTDYGLKYEYSINNNETLMLSLLNYHDNQLEGLEENILKNDIYVFLKNS